MRGALKHPLIQRAARAQALRRETPVQHYRDDGTLIEGVVDLAFQEITPEFNGWTVVDFKTDREIEQAENQYRAQVAAYVEGCPCGNRVAGPKLSYLLSSPLRNLRSWYSCLTVVAPGQIAHLSGDGSHCGMRLNFHNTRRRRTDPIL